MAKTALLIIDMQNFFAEMTNTCIPNILILSEHFRKSGMLQIVTQHGHSEDELSGKVKNQLVRKWGSGGSIARDSDDWQLMPEIQSATQASGLSKKDIVAKNTYDAFINTDLEERLRDHLVERVFVCGVMTDCCCDTTARSSFNRGFETWLISDACGSANKTQHQAGLKGFGFAFGEVLDTKTAIERLQIDASSS